MEQNFTYIVECADGSFYTGWTNDIKKRIECHNAGKGAKYTKPRLPVRLIYLEKWDTKQSAMKREAEIKKFSRKQKEKLVQLYHGEAIIKNDETFDRTVGI